VSLTLVGEQMAQRVIVILASIIPLCLGAPSQAGERDFTEAAKMYRLAADQGNALAQSTLGVMYAKGSGVPQDYTEAVKLFRLAASQANARGQNGLGVMYRNGQGVSKDFIEAATLFRLAADQGYAAAQNNLGLAYEKGQGVTQDFAEAMKFYRLAAAKGYDQARNNLENLSAQTAKAMAYQPITRATPVTSDTYPPPAPKSKPTQPNYEMSTEAGIRAQADRIYPWASQSEQRELWIANRMSEQWDRQYGNSYSLRINR